MAIVKKHWFNILLIVLFGLAYARPDWGEPDGPLRPDVLRTAAIVLIFFVTGLGLRFDELRQGAGKIRLHLLSQGFCFVFIPLVCVALRASFRGIFPEQLLDGIVLLAILPTTITSCVVFTTLAKGDVAGAVFNAVGGNLAGVFVSPLLFALLIAPQAGLHVQWAQLLSIALIIVLPLAVGVTLRPFTERLLEPVRPILPYVSGSALLLIVYFAFAQALGDASPLWSYTAADVAGPLIVLTLLHAFLLFSAWYGAVLLKLPPSDRRTIVFTAPQKTVALGLPLIAVFFAQRPELAGVVSLPLIFYHPLQLLVAGPLAARMAARADDFSGERASDR